MWIAEVPCLFRFVLVGEMQRDFVGVFNKTIIPLAIVGYEVIDNQRGALHMSHVYQNCQRANGLAWTAWMKNQNIVAMNISFLKTHRDSRILHNRTAKKTWQIMWRKRIFKWQPSKLLWIWIFGAVTKVRTTEKNYYLGRLLWSCLKPQAGFAEREKKLYCRLDCSSEWLHSLYLMKLVTCDLYSWCRINKPQLSIGEWLDRRMASRSWRNNTCLLS